MAIIPIPTSRVGDYFIRQRLIGQVQSDQLDLFRLQTQISTGRRLLLPSDDAPAALRAMNVQRVLQRKEQVQSNLINSKSVLSAADASLSTVAQQLNDVRVAALGVADTVTSNVDRQAIINLVDASLETLLTTVNTSYKGRYLFAGSRTDTRPFEFNNEYVQYFGNEKELQNYVDLEQLFATNLPGSEVFGGRSAKVVSNVDLDPQLSAGTLLSSINGGTGLGSNAAISISVTDGGNTETSIVDLSGAVTIGDVIRLIEANPPDGSNVTVEISNNGLTLQTDGDTIRIDEVAGGRTARELGIFMSSGETATNTKVGADLDPTVSKTTLLSNLLGRKATGRVSFSGANNDLILRAAANGTEFNDIDVVFVSDVVAGAENAVFDANAGTLTIHIQEGETTAAAVAAAINAEGTFSATPDYRDSTSASQAGTGLVEAGPPNHIDVTSGGTGSALDTASGLVLTNGGETVSLDVSEAETVEDLLNLITGSGVGLVGEINASGTGINVRSVLSGADFTIGEDGGDTATLLGIRTYTGATQLADFNRGIGVPMSDTSDDLEIVDRNGESLTVDLTGATTVEDVIQAINDAASDANVDITARLATAGNGIEIVDTTGGSGNLAVNAVPGSQAAEYLGFVPGAAPTDDGSGNHVIASEDRHTLEVDSVFNSLIRLKHALSEGDPVAIGQAIDRIDDDLSRVTFARAEVGARLQSLDVVQTRLEDENVQLQSALSQDLDVDLVEAISSLTARQYAMQASLQTAASILNLSLLDYI